MHPYSLERVAVSVGQAWIEREIFLLAMKNSTRKDLLNWIGSRPSGARRPLEVTGHVRAFFACNGSDGAMKWS